jgi:hypothetical protein
MHPRHSVIPATTSSTPPKQPLIATLIPQKDLTLSRKVDECKPLPGGVRMISSQLRFAAEGEAMSKLPPGFKDMVLW